MGQDHFRFNSSFNNCIMKYFFSETQINKRLNCPNPNREVHLYLNKPILTLTYNRRIQVFCILRSFAYELGLAFSVRFRVVLDSNSYFNHSKTHETHLLPNPKKTQTALSLTVRFILALTVKFTFILFFLIQFSTIAIKNYIFS